MTRAGILVIAWVAAAGCGSKKSRGESGRVAAAGLSAGVEAAAVEKAPWRCARAAGETLVLGDAHAIAVVADARAPTDDTLAALGGLHRAFKDAGVGVVFTAGGMGTAQPDLERTLGALVDPAWTVVALPGAAEGVPALRRAIAVLHGKGAAIVDGSTVRLIDVAGATVVTVPGEAFASRLAAGADGCVRDRADLDAALLRLGRNVTRDKPEPWIVVSATAPRGRGDSSDRAPGGVHAGDLDLAAALAAHPVDLIVHPQIGPPPAAGHLGPGDTWPDDAVAAGIADATPRYDDAGRRLPPTALVIAVDRSGIRWQSVGAASP